MQKDRLLELYRQMYLIRRFEEASAEAYFQAQIRGFCHLYVGEEAVAVGAIAALRDTDHIITHYRDHGHALARGMDPNAVMAELYGKATGSSLGHGGSMHLADTRRNVWGGWAIVGAHQLLATGMAWAAKQLQEDRVVCCFFGDGSTNQGEFFEALNMSALWKLPVVFICENNEYGMGTHLRKATAVTDLYRKAEPYMPSKPVDGMDVLAMHDTVAEAAEHARSGGGPVFLEALCYRYRGHSTADPEIYRTEEDVKPWRERDPIEAFGQRLIAGNGIGDKDLALIRKRVDRQVDEAVKFAAESPQPPMESTYKYVYSTPVPDYDPADRPTGALPKLQRSGDD